MAGSLPAEVLELVLRADGVPTNVDGRSLGAVLDRRALLRSAALVSRGWHDVATRLLAAVIVVTSSVDVVAIGRAIKSGWLRGEDVVALIVDDWEVEEFEARDVARRLCLEAARAARASGAAVDPQHQTVADFLDEAVVCALDAFSRALWALAASMPRLTTVTTAYWRSMNGHAGDPPLRSLSVQSIAPRCDADPSQWLSF